MGISQLSRLRLRASRLCGAVILLLAVTSVAWEPTPSASALTDSDINVVMIVLDEAPLFPLLKTDGTINRVRFPGFASLADNSTWYRNMVGTAQRTTEAVPAILDGNLPTFSGYPTAKDHPNNLFSYMNGKKNLDVYQAITSLCPNKMCPNAPPDSARMLYKQVLRLEEVTQRAATSTTPTLHFAHVLLPHRPWGLAPDLRIAPDIEKFPDHRSERFVDRRRDNYQSMLRQYVATDVLIGDLVSKLKASPNWNKTMLIVTADHGITFEPGKSYRDHIDVNSPGTLEDIYRVPLFIKYPFQTAASQNDCTASSIDILPSIVAANGVRSGWRTQGSDLKSKCSNRTSRTIRWPLGTYELSTKFAALVERVKYYDNWIDADGDIDSIYRAGRSGDLLGTSVPTNSKRRSGVTWRLNGATNYQSVAIGHLAPVPTRASGTVTINEPMCDKCEGLLEINGQFVGTLPELTGTRPENGVIPFSSSLMSRLIQPGKSTINLWIADWSTATPTLMQVGPPKN